MTAMLNLPSFSSSRLPMAIRSSKVTPYEAAKVPKYFFISSGEKRSMPAGTGVCVVNTPPARTDSTASLNVNPLATSSRMRSSDRKPAWPSLVWNTCGCSPSARNTRTPPMPSTISWRRRCSVSPPYKRLVMAAASGLLPSTLVSRRYSGTRPTCTFHTLMRTCSPAISSVTCTSVVCIARPNGSSGG